MIPGPAAIALTVLGGLLFIHARTEADGTTANVVLMVAAAVAGFTLASLVLAPVNVLGLIATRTLPQRTVVGRTVTCTMTLSRRFWPLPSLLLVLREQPTALLRFPDEFAVCPVVPPWGTATVSYNLLFLRRGVHTIAGVRLMSSFPGGVFRVWGWLSAPATITVHPRPARLPQWLRQELATPVWRDANECGGLNGSEDLLGLREYRPGDSVRRIHWPTTARAGRPMVLDLSSGHRDAIELLIDTCGEGADPTRLKAELEQLLGVAFGIACHIARRGGQVAVCHHSGRLQRTPPASGVTGINEVGDLLAGVRISETPADKWLGQARQRAVRDGLRPVVLSLGRTESPRQSPGEEGRGALTLSTADLRFAAIFAAAGSGWSGASATRRGAASGSGATSASSRRRAASPSARLAASPSVGADGKGSGT